MSSAIQPGTDFDLRTMVEAKTCARCRDRYILMASWFRLKLRVPEWCPACNHDILRDPDEDRFWASRQKPITPFLFLGWRFAIVRGPGPYPINFLRLYKRLLHPEAPNRELSVATFGESTTPIETAAAWLIAHWWEHALDICPCQLGQREDEQGSNFRRQLTQSLLWWHQQGFSARQRP